MSALTICLPRPTGMKDDGEFYRLIYDLNVLARETRRKWREPRSSWRSSSRQRASRLDDLPHGNYALRLCGLQKVHLELDGEHVPIGGHDRERGYHVPSLPPYHQTSPSVAVS